VKKQTRGKRTRKPKGWVDNPKTLADVIQSLQALGCEVAHRPVGDPRKVKL
jgi:hypothetical protein